MIYEFECWSEKDGCGQKFEVECSMAEIPNLKPSCPSCNKTESVIRDWSRIHLFGPNKSLGMLAEANNKLLSPSQKKALHAKHNAYKEPCTIKPLTKEEQERKNRGEKLNHRKTN